jgi:septal ring factor EnvC (AmiA/AmiB activator)
MSTTVKVFIVLILVMSLAFMFTTMTQYATRENWKRRWDQDTKELTAELNESNQNRADLSMRLTKADNQVVNLNTQITDQQTKIKEQENGITDLKQTVQNKDLQLKKQETDYNALKEDFMAQSRSLEMVRQRNAELTHIAQVARAVAFNLNVKLAEVEDDLNNAQTELTQRAQDIDSLTKDLKKNQAMMGLIRERYPKIWTEVNDQTASDRYLSAVVAAVRANPQGQQDLVMLTIGKDEKVEEGVEFIVYRNNQYIVKVRAERIMNDMVACRVIPETWNTNNLQIAQGDLATNRL